MLFCVFVLIFLLLSFFKRVQHDDYSNCVSMSVFCNCFSFFKKCLQKDKICKSYFSLPIVINDFDSVVFRKICNKFLKWFSIAKRNNSKKPKEKNEFVFCVAILFSSVKLELLTGFFQFFFFLSNKWLFFSNK